jgi:hypothetical protein
MTMAHYLRHLFPPPPTNQTHCPALVVACEHTQQWHAVFVVVAGVYRVALGWWLIAGPRIPASTRARCVTLVCVCVWTCVRFMLCFSFFAFYLCICQVL